MTIDTNDLEAINVRMQSLTALERIVWAHDQFGVGLVLSTSFGLQSSVMLDLVLKVSKEIPVIFVDTGHLFPETYQYALAL